MNVAVARIDGVRRDRDDPRLEQAMGALERMDELIDDVLGLARSGREVVDPVPVELAGTAIRAWNMAGISDAVLEIEGAPGRIYADEGKARQLLENLFRNAHEHVGKDVTVRIGRMERGFYVEDDGPGVPPDEREAVFESGYTTSDRGTGFGLPIVQETASAHGWNVRIVEGRDGGARFEVTGVEFAE